MNAIAASSSTDPGPVRRFGCAWVALALAIGVHVADEALTGFLGVYNPMVRAIRQRLPFLPLPTFTFGIWLAGLVAGVTLLLALAPLALRGSRRIVGIAFPLSLLMCANGAGHIAGSFYLGRPAPGVLSTPLLLVAAAWLLVEAVRRREAP